MHNYDHVFERFPVLDIDEEYVLREITYDDAEDYLAYLQDDGVGKWVPDECLPDTIEKAKEEVKYHLELFRFQRSLYWMIARKDNNKLIGSCGFNYWSRDHERAEISYDLHKDYWNRGIITKAVRAVLGYAFSTMHMNRIEATVTPGNEASLRVLRKIGFKKEGILREQKRLHGKYTDAIMFSILRREYLGF